MRSSYQLVAISYDSYSATAMICIAVSTIMCNTVIHLYTVMYVYYFISWLVPILLSQPCHAIIVVVHHIVIASYCCLYFMRVYIMSDHSTTSGMIAATSYYVAIMYIGCYY